MKGEETNYHEYICYHIKVNAERIKTISFIIVIGNIMPSATCSLVKLIYRLLVYYIIHIRVFYEWHGYLYINCDTIFEMMNFRWMKLRQDVLKKNN